MATTGDVSRFRRLQGDRTPIGLLNRDVLSPGSPREELVQAGTQLVGVDRGARDASKVTQGKAGRAVHPHPDRRRSVGSQRRGTLDAPRRGGVTATDCPRPDTCPVPDVDDVDLR